MLYTGILSTGHPSWLSSPLILLHNMDVIHRNPFHRPPITACTSTHPPAQHGCYTQESLPQATHHGLHLHSSSCTTWMLYTGIPSTGHPSRLAYPLILLHNMDVIHRNPFHRPPFMGHPSRLLSPLILLHNMDVIRRNPF